jgi:dTDP-4-dehydrorhamnose 3,5-epimerase
MPRRLETTLEGLILVEPETHGDARGFFVETFRTKDWGELGIAVDFVQENHSRSVKGTLRGLHLQVDPGQAKLVRCARGRIWDVAVDLRQGSESYGRWEAHELDDELNRQLYVPIGFAHGFCVLSDVADVTYKVSSYYRPDRELSIAWNDPDIGIDWPLPDPLVSDRDAAARRLAEMGGVLPA